MTKDLYYLVDKDLAGMATVVLVPCLLNYIFTTLLFGYDNFYDTF